MAQVVDVQFTPDQEAFISQAIKSGRFLREEGEEDAVIEALSLWEERERARAEILAAIDEAEASIRDGEGRTITAEAMRELSLLVKQRGRARLNMEQPLP